MFLKKKFGTGIYTLNARNKHHTILIGSGGQGRSQISESPWRLHYLNQVFLINNQLAQNLLGWTYGFDGVFSCWLNKQGQPVTIDFGGKTSVLTPSPAQLNSPWSFQSFAPIDNPYNYPFWEIIEQALTQHNIKLSQTEDAIAAATPSQHISMTIKELSTLSNEQKPCQVASDSFMKGVVILALLSKIHTSSNVPL